MRINDKENYDKIRSSITMNNLKTIIDSRNFTTTKVAMNSKITNSTLSSYMLGQKIPSLPTLISIADYLNCNLDYLLDRTDNPIKINDYESNIKNNEELNLLFQSIVSMNKEQQDLVIAFTNGILSKK